MKLDPDPRPWEALFTGSNQGGDDIEPIPQLLAEAVIAIEEEEAGYISEIDSTSEGTSGEYWFEDTEEETLTEVSEEGTENGPQDPWADIPQGMLLQRYTYVFDCLTCDATVSLSFLAEGDAARLLAALVDGARLNPICSGCLQEAEGEAAPVNSPALPTPPPEPEDQHGGQ